MEFNRLSKALLLTGSMLVISGCTSMYEIGEEPTECPKSAEGGIPCTSARDIWKLSNNQADLDKVRAENVAKDGNYDEEVSTDKEEEPQKPTPYPGGTPSERKAIYQDTVQYQNQLAAPEPMAVRERAKVLRVLMNSWEDEQGRLHMPGYTYVEIEKRKWVVGRGATTAPSRITPLSIRKASLTEERKHNPVGDNGMGIIQPVNLEQTKK